MEDHVEIGTRALDVLAEESRRVRLVHGAVEHPPRLDVLPTDVHEAQMRADGARRDDHALDEGVGIALHEIAILKVPGSPSSALMTR